MRFVLRAGLLALISMASAVAQTGQSPKSAHPASVAWKRYCQANGGFCFNYPPSWKMMGEIYDGNGVVIAPPQKDEQALWNEITVAMVAPPKGSDEALGLDAIIEQAAAGMRDSGQDFRILRRGVLTAAPRPAELLKTQYHEKSTGRDWIEELIFIQGPDNEIYSVALKCGPRDIERLEPVFSDIVRTWKLPEPEPPAMLDGEAPSPATPNQKAPEAQPH
jgi:hypothetical protein